MPKKYAMRDIVVSFIIYLFIHYCYYYFLATFFFQNPLSQSQAITITKTNLPYFPFFPFSLFIIITLYILY